MQKGDSGDYDINYVGDDSDDEGGTNGSRGHSPDDTAANPGSNSAVEYMRISGALCVEGRKGSSFRKENSWALTSLRRKGYLSAFRT